MDNSQHNKLIKKTKFMKHCYYYCGVDDAPFCSMWDGEASGPVNIKE